MKKTKVIMAVSAALVLAVFCVSAGCVSEDDPVVGTYVVPGSDGSRTVFDFSANGTMDVIAISPDNTKIIKIVSSWVKSDSGVYTASYKTSKGSTPLDGSFKLSDDGSKLVFTNTSGITSTAGRVSDFTMPEGIEVEVLDTTVI